MNKAFEKILERLSNISRVVKTDEDAEWNRAIYKSTEIVHEVAKEYNGGWIPCSERFPEEKYAVLVWCPERKNTYCAYLEEGQWWIFGAYFEKVKLEVIAWMPLPEPYKA